MEALAAQLVDWQQEADSYAAGQRRFDLSKPREAFVQEYMMRMLTDRLPRSAEWAISVHHRQQ